MTTTDRGPGQGAGARPAARAAAGRPAAGRAADGAPGEVAAAAVGAEHPFEAPAHEVDLPLEWGPLLRFLWRRSLRLVVAPLVVLTMGLLLLPTEATWPIVAGLVTIGLMLYLPTTLILFRTRFLPRDPDRDELVLADGERVHAGDYLQAVRASAAENLLGTLPLGILAVYAALNTGIVGVVGGVACLALAGFNAVLAVVNAGLGESTVHLGRTRPDLAAERLRPLTRLPLPARLGDPVWHQLAIVRFRQGDLDGMLAALDRVRDAEGYGVPLLRAQALLGRGGLDEAKALIASPPDDPDLEQAHEALGALVALHDGRPDEVRTHRERWEDRRDEVAAHQARFRDLVLAAALAEDEPDEARRLLRRSRWTTERLGWLQRVWPAVGERLAGLDGW